MHPLAVQILDTSTGLEEREKLSPRELAERLGQRLPNVSYHVRVLADAGRLKLVGKRQVRGAVQHVYRLT
jgi:DNA-binding transcriptional ArsR family regulator